MIVGRESSILIVISTGARVLVRRVNGTKPREYATRGGAARDVLSG